MISRLVIATILTATTLSAVAVKTAQNTKPTLYVFSGPGPDGRLCGGCVAFDAAMRSREFSRQVRQLVNIRGPYDVRNRQSAALARDYKVTSWPTFVVLHEGRIIRRAIGFENSAEFRSGFLRSLTLTVETECKDGICKPITQTVPLPPSTDIAPPAVNPVDRIAEVNARLQLRLQATEDALKITEDRLQTERKRQKLGADNAAQQRWAAERRVLEAARERAIHEAAELRSRLSQPSAAPFESPDEMRSRLPSGPQTADFSAEKSVSELSSSKWAAFFGWAKSTAITLAAPEFVIPGSIALTALGFGVKTFKNRQQRQLWRQQQINAAKPEVIDARDRVRTELKRVVEVVDYEGRAWKEAVKRCANTHNTNPAALAILQQLDSTASQIINGEQVQRKTQPND